MEEQTEIVTLCVFLSCCVTSIPLQLYSVYSADKLNNLKGSVRDGFPPFSLSTLSVEIITEPFLTPPDEEAADFTGQTKANCDFKALPRIQLSDGIKQDWKPNICLEEIGSSWKQSAVKDFVSSSY